MKSFNDPASIGRHSSRKIRQIGELLSRLGYSEPRIQDLLHCDDVDRSEKQWGLPLFVRRSRGGDRLGILVRLFLLRQAVDLDAVCCDIEPTRLKDWVAAGLLEVKAEQVIGIVKLCPYGSLAFATDWPDDPKSNLHQVMGISASSRTLAQATIRRHARTTLDLGTGCGVLALLAAAHSEHVVAVDSNLRALHMAKFNAQLNGSFQIEFMEGNLFEPVTGRQFDLIVCNPPFIVAPEQIYLHSYSGQHLDRLCETIARSAPAFLRENGYCQILCNWVQLAGQDWRARLRSWFDGSGCDAWVLHSHSEETADYAFNRIANLALSSEQMERRFNSWMEYYDREHIEAIGFGLITMRRANRSANWFRCESWPEMLGSCGDAIERGFAARDFLEDCNDRDLLETRVRNAPNLRWRQEHDVSDLGSAVHSSLHFTSGLAYTANMDSAIVKFVSRCAGDRPLSDYLVETAAMSGEEPIQFAPRFLKTVRRLIELGFLLPVAGRTNQPAS